MTTTLVAGCMACDILAGRIRPPGGVIYSDAHWLVDHQCGPVELAGYLILKPKRHVEDFAALTAAEAAAYGPVLRATCQALTRVVHPERVYVVSMGEAVRHLHVLVLPRAAIAAARALALLQEVWDGKWAPTDEAAAAVAGRVRAERQRLLRQGGA